MISQREVERQYRKLKIEAAPVNRFNCYVCHNPGCRNIMKTVDIHLGVTPMFMNCPKCGTRSSSTGYKDIVPDAKPTREWFVPTLDQCLKMRNQPGMLDHIFSGGLEIRTIKNANL